MNVLVACEESQIVTTAFRAKGHQAFSCDLKPCSGGHPEWHIQDDVIPYLNGASDSFYHFSHFSTEDGTLHELPWKWDLIIAHPPCTYLSKAGARHMYPISGHVNPDRLRLAAGAKLFFYTCLNADSPRICVENPTPLKIVDLPDHSQVIQPFMFGHPFSKRTLLWLKGLPELKPTTILTEYSPYCPSNTGNYSRGKGGGKGAARSACERSKTFPGIALAMAEQWG